jgi:hypothetical protein
MMVYSMSSVVLLMWSDAAGRVPMKTLSVVTVLLVVDRIYYHCCIQYRLEPFDMRIDLFIILREMGVIWSTSILEAKALWTGVR